MKTNPAQQFPNDLIGVCKTIGDIGPPYQIIGPSPTGDHSLARIVLLESGQEADYPVEDLVADPVAP